MMEENEDDVWFDAGESNLDWDHENESEADSGDVFYESVDGSEKVADNNGMTRLRAILQQCKRWLSGQKGESAENESGEESDTRSVIGTEAEIEEIIKEIDQIEERIETPENSSFHQDPSRLTAMLNYIRNLIENQTLFEPVPMADHENELETITGTEGLQDRETEIALSTRRAPSQWNLFNRLFVREDGDELIDDRDDQPEYIGNSAAIDNGDEKKHDLSGFQEDRIVIEGSTKPASEPAQITFPVATCLIVLVLIALAYGLSKFLKRKTVRKRHHQLHSKLSNTINADSDSGHDQLVAPY